MLCAKFGWNWPSGSGEDFKISSMYFLAFVIISPWKRVWSFMWIKFNPLYPRMLCAKFSLNWLSGSGQEDFYVLSMYFHYFVIITPWKKARLFIWINLNPLQPTNLNPLQPRMLSAKFGWNWPSGSGEEDFFLFRQCIFAISLLSPLGKERGTSFEQNWIPFTQGCIVSSLVEIRPVVLKKKIF